MGYGFYLGKVVTVAQAKDVRLGVKVLPQMEDIPNEKCPIWPSFFRDELYTGNEGDLVWVICDDEFSMGYVFGLANYNTYPDIDEFEKSYDNKNLSLPSDLRDGVRKSILSIDGVMLSLDNVKITYWDDNCIHYIERSSGMKVIAYKSGTLYMFKEDEFLIKIGSTIMKMSASGFSVSSDAIKLQSSYVGLGDSSCSGSVLVTNGTSGESAYPSSSVHA